MTEQDSESFDRDTLRAQLIPREVGEAAELNAKKLARFSQLVSTPETWFYAGDGLIGAMRLLEEPIENHWNSINPVFEHQPREVESDVGGRAHDARGLRN